MHLQSQRPSSRHRRIPRIGPVMCLNTLCESTLAVTTRPELYSTLTGQVVWRHNDDNAHRGEVDLDVLGYPSIVDRNEQR